MPVSRVVSNAMGDEMLWGIHIGMESAHFLFADGE